MSEKETFQEQVTRLKAKRDEIVATPLTEDSIRRYREITREISLAGLNELDRILRENPPLPVPRRDDSWLASIAASTKM